MKKRRDFVKFKITGALISNLTKLVVYGERREIACHFIQWTPNINSEQTEAPDFRCVRIRGVSLRVSVLGCIFRASVTPW